MKRWLNEGKTKIVFLDDDYPGIVFLEQKDFVTWKNKFSEPLPGKGALATETTGNLFGILAAKGRETAFIKQTGPNTFTEVHGDMVLIEAVLRFENREESSYHMQYPEVPIGPFEKPVSQLFLKTTKGKFGDIDVSELGDDPLITEIERDGVWVHRADQKVKGRGTRIPYRQAGFDGDLRVLLKEVEDAVRIDGTIIHDAFGLIDWSMGDIKIEYLILPAVQMVPRRARLIPADVIDADSLRVKDENGIERSKQTVRNKNSVEGALVHYHLVAKKTGEMLRKVLAT